MKTIPIDIDWHKLVLVMNEAGIRADSLGKYGLDAQFIYSIRKNGKANPYWHNCVNLWRAACDRLTEEERESARLENQPG